MFAFFGKNMNFRHVKLLRNTILVQCESKTNYSGRNDSNLDNVYKVLSKVNNRSKGSKNSPLAPLPNWEILKPNGYRFFLPGHVGPGWHDFQAGPFCLPPVSDFASEIIDFRFSAQDCPILLRPAVSELFPGIDFSYAHLCIIGLTEKRVKRVNDHEIENVVKTFVLTAQNICRKLRDNGCWADFINPFSGLPGFSTYKDKDDLYATDPRFRSLGFRISERENCTIIEDKKSCRFRGNLFTTAPANATFLKEILLPSTKC